MFWNDRREFFSRQVEDARNEGDVDYARVIHSASFRRLQGKTQILNLGDSDFYRTRLTHSLEVAQIAGGIAKQLAETFSSHDATLYLPSRSLIQAIGCAHDLGHPPFGHGGEVALNYCMRKNSENQSVGFEGNGQTLRILSKLENFSATAGANLTRRTLLGVLKYPVMYSMAQNSNIIPCLVEGTSTIQIIDSKKSKPPKCYLDSEEGVVDWILQKLPASDKEEFQKVVTRDGKHNSSIHKSLDCSIMDVADDIAYGVHDLEDAIALKLIDEQQFRASVSEDVCGCFLDALKEKYPKETGNDIYNHLILGLFRDGGTRKRFIGRLVHHFITAIEYVEFEQFETPLIRYRVALKSAQRKFLDALQNFVTNEVIKSPRVQHLEFKGQTMVVAVFEALQSDPQRLLPQDTFSEFKNSDDDLRVISDFVSGMTDTYLLKTYERLFAPRMGSVFDKL